MGSLAGLSAIVTGASRGIGRAIAMELARDGAAVVVNYCKRAEDAEALVSDIHTAGGKAQAFCADVSSESDVRKMVEFALLQHGRLDILVCNAGVTRDLLLGSMKLEDWENVMAINVRGVFLSIREVLPHMISQRSGVIIAMSSVAAERGGRGHANYVASKGAINAMTRSLAVELAPRGIRVNAVAPGIIVTDMSKRIRTFGGDDLQVQIPLKRFGEPREVARAVCFLASPDASYITGEVLHVAGGFGV
jgi:3-oxoacyl-[acyl-carrier protein] reductase